MNPEILRFLERLFLKASDILNSNKQTEKIPDQECSYKNAKRWLFASHCCCWNPNLSFGMIFQTFLHSFPELHISLKRIGKSFLYWKNAVYLNWESQNLIHEKRLLFVKLYHFSDHKQCICIYLNGF